MASGATKKLNDFGYGFKGNEGKISQPAFSPYVCFTDGQLYQVDKSTGLLTDRRFEFNLYREHAKNQKNYEALGEVSRFVECHWTPLGNVNYFLFQIITDYVYDLLEENGMHKAKIPLDAKEDSETSFIFTSQKELKNPKKLLVLIHGSGVVRAGQWARSLIINNSIKEGTQIPYINEGRSRDFEVVSLNTNENYGVNGQKLPHSENPVAHAKYVWENIIQPANPESVAIVAHSYGGHVTMALAREYPEFFVDKVFAVAFTDSVENTAPEVIREHMNKITVNWAASDKPLDTVLRPKGNSGVEFRSAAHVKHEFTTYSSQNAVFDFIDQRYKEFLGEAHSVAKKPKLDEL